MVRSTPHILQHKFTKFASQFSISATSFRYFYVIRVFKIEAKKNSFLIFPKGVLISCSPKNNCNSPSYQAQFK